MFLFEMRSIPMRLFPAGRRRSELRVRECVPSWQRVLTRALAVSVVLGLSAHAALSQGAYKDEEPGAAAQAAPPTPPPQFVQTCALCHGKDAKGTAIAPALANSAHVQAMSDGDIAEMIHKGKGKMPPVMVPLSADDIAAVTKFLRAINPKGPAAAGKPQAMLEARPAGAQGQAGMGQSVAMMQGGRGPGGGGGQGFGGGRGQGFGPTQAPEAPKAFAQTCSLCHGNDARGTDRAPTLINPDHFRTLTDEDLSNVVMKGKGKMPALPLPPDDLQAVTRFIRAVNSTTTAAAAVPGDAHAGETVFFGSGQCSSCHMVHGVGSANGPDLSGTGRKLRLADLQRLL